MANSRSKPVFEIYRDKKGEYRWRARARNGNLLAAASEGYKDKRDAVHCARLFGHDPKAVVPVKKPAAATEAAPKPAAAKPKTARPKSAAVAAEPPKPEPAG